MLMRGAPLANPFFRPKEEHIASRENNVFPPFGRGNKAVKKPVAGRRTFQANLQIEQFTRLFATRMNLPATMKRCGNTECIPAAVREILCSIGDDDMLGRHTGDGLCPVSAKCR